MDQIQESKLDKQISNLDYINKYCKNYKSDFNDELNKNCNKLLEISRFFNEIYPQYTFKNIQHNGFKLFVNVATAFTDKIIHQIKDKKKIDPNLTKFFPLIFFYSEWISNILNMLKNDTNEEYNSIMCCKPILSSKFFYRNIQ